MAAKKTAKKRVTAYSPKGTKVTVTEDVAKKLAGYTTTKPKAD